MMWNGTIKSLMLTYLKNFATCFLACELLYNKGIKENVTTFIVSVILGLPLVFFPIWSSVFLMKNKS